ncbi:MAG TPA: hypothetical protein VJV87_00945, partial [Sphingomicrobium sp.]|nr:hypothetical protein [Sphingomicrobium sp.]
WMALRFFSRANSFSRTPSAFAEFQATTRGTATQAIKALLITDPTASAESIAKREQCSVRKVNRTLSLAHPHVVKALECPSQGDRVK